MKTLKYKTLLLTVFFFYFLNNYCHAQNDDALFTDRNKLQLTVQPILYNKGIVERQMGDYELKSKSTLSGNVGLLYRFHETGNWNFQSGIIVGLQPVYNVELSLKDEDIIFEEGISFSHKAYSVNTFNYTIPIYAEYTNRLSSRLYFSVMGGFKATLLGSNLSLLGVSVLDENEEDVVQVFGLVADTASKYGIYPQLELNTGLYYRGIKRFYKISLIYNKSLMNTYEGYYKFDNLIESPRTTGNYKLNGDYFGISISTALRRY